MSASNASSPAPDRPGHEPIPPSAVPPAWPRVQLALGLASALALGSFCSVLFGVVGDASERRNWQAQRVGHLDALGTLGTERSRLERELAELGRNREALAGDLARLRTETESGQAAATRLREEAGKLRQEVTDNRAELEAAGRRRDGLASAIRNAEATLTGLNDQRETAERQSGEAEERRRAAAEAERSARAQQGKAEQGRDAALAQQKEAERRLGQAEQELKTAAERVDGLHGQEPS